MTQVDSARSQRSGTLLAFCGTAVSADEWEIVREIVDM